VCEDAERAARAHRPVLADEVMFLLRPRDEGWVVDGTVGMGGHSERLMESGGGRSSRFQKWSGPGRLAGQSYY